MRREARIESDRIRGLWEAASNAYAVALSSADDDKQRLAAQRAAAIALSRTHQRVAARTSAGRVIDDVC
jgi:hypothetical protein